MHLRGFKFYVVGTGVGDFDNVSDLLPYNLVDPLEANIVPIPKDGWATIRFVASNPSTFINLISYDKIHFGLVLCFVYVSCDLQLCFILALFRDKKCSICFNFIPCIL